METLLFFQKQLCARDYGRQCARPVWLLLLLHTTQLSPPVQGLQLVMLDQGVFVFQGR